MSESKRFDDYTCTVDCEECEHYWTNQCDGVTKGTQKVCNSFLATRKVVIPAQIKSLQSDVRRLRIYLMVCQGILLVHLLMHLFGGV